VKKWACQVGARRFINGSTGFNSRQVHFLFYELFRLSFKIRFAAASRV
jgi:hypothetical protein